MESFEYPQFNVQTSISLFTAVQNAAKLRARIVQAASLTGSEGDLEREAVSFAFIDARLVSLSSVAFYLVFNFWCNQDHKSTASADGDLLCATSSSSEHPQNQDSSFGDIMGFKP